MLNLWFGGAVVYVPVSASCAECNLFEIRGSIFHVGDHTIVIWWVRSWWLGNRHNGRQFTSIGYSPQPGLIDGLNNCTTEGVILAAVCFNILAEIPSGPLDLETSRLKSTSNAESLSQRSLTGWSSERSTLLSVTSSRGALRELKHLEKNRLNMSTFCELVWASLPSSSIREGIVVCCLLRWLCYPTVTCWCGLPGVLLRLFCDISHTHSLCFMICLLLLDRGCTCRKSYCILCNREKGIRWTLTLTLTQQSQSALYSSYFFIVSHSLTLLLYSLYLDDHAKQRKGEVVSAYSSKYSIWADRALVQTKSDSYM